MRINRETGALSFSDCYWIKAEDDSICFEEISPYYKPFWDGNEVWLITAGGAMFAAFPHVYATMFSGFYLALFLILSVLFVPVRYRLAGCFEETKKAEALVSWGGIVFRARAAYEYEKDLRYAVRIFGVTIHVNLLTKES